MSVVAEQDFASIETKPGEADARMQTRPHFWSGRTSGGSAAHSVFCAEHYSRSGCPCSLHRLLQNGPKFGFRAYRGRDWTELECAVFDVSSWLLRRAGNP